MRVVFLVLLASNLLYFAWAGWVGAPAPSATALPAVALPRLVLASESPPTPDAPSSAEAAQLAAAASGDGVAGQSVRCVSVGPFNDLELAARGAAMLRERGFDPRQRAVEGEQWEGWWVYVGDVGSANDESRMLQTLERSGIRDARAMPDTGEGRRVSIGLFTERGRAEKSAAAVRKLGFRPEIAERSQPGTVYWVDLELAASDAAVPTEGLLSLEGAGAKLEVRACPTSDENPPPNTPIAAPRQTLPAATTADARRSRAS